MFQNLKTSDRISLSFSLFTLAALFLFLISINLIYFYIWYEDQKQKSLETMVFDNNSSINSQDLNVFKQHILTQDTLIIPDDPQKEVICSPWVADKLHGNTQAIQQLQQSLFYKEDGKIFFIFSQHYPGLGEVKILFDTTQYINSQLIIIKISLILMVFFTIGIYFLWRVISKRALCGLMSIASQAQQDQTITQQRPITISGPENDEIKILADTINDAFAQIHTQTNHQKQFITDVSHEFKTPLMWINSKIDLYNKKCEKWVCSPNELQNLFLSLKTSTKKLNSLLETLFLFSRMQDGITCFDKKSVNLSECIMHETDMILLSYIDSWVQIEYEIEAGVFQNIEESSFNILLSNLLTNAIKFSHHGGKIRVGVSQNSFWIEDQGIWIENNELTKIWDKFYRHDLGKEWFGIGLFIVKRVLELYDWDIKVTSQIKKGSRFEVFFK